MASVELMKQEITRAEHNVVLKSFAAAVARGIRSGALTRWLRASIAWRLVKKTNDWLYFGNEVDGQRFAVQSRQGGDEAIDLAFMRQGDIFWGRDGLQMVGRKRHAWNRLRADMSGDAKIAVWKEWR